MGRDLYDCRLIPGLALTVFAVERMCSTHNRAVVPHGKWTLKWGSLDRILASVLGNKTTQEKQEGQG